MPRRHLLPFRTRCPPVSRFSDGFHFGTDLSSAADKRPIVCINWWIFNWTRFRRGNRLDGRDRRDSPTTPGKNVSNPPAVRLIREGRSDSNEDDLFDDPSSSFHPPARNRKIVRRKLVSSSRTLAPRYTCPEFRAWNLVKRIYENRRRCPRRCPRTCLHEPPTLRLRPTKNDLVIK